MVLLPLLEIAARQLFGQGIPASGPIVQNLTLWVGFLGAALAARQGELLSLATGELLPKGKPRELAKIFASAVAAGVAAMLARASAALVLIEREGGMEIGAGIPVWVVELVLPVSFALIALRLAWRASDRWWGRAIAFGGAGAGLWLGWNEAILAGKSAWPGVGLVILATLLGGPIFAALGGAALFLFLADGVPAAAIPAETYRLGVSPTLAAIPLFTLTGFLLAEGKASERLLRVFRGFFGWIPGGTAVVTAALCAFFTVFTGGSGVTILALGGLLLPTLLADGYRERFSLGLLTASGSLGLLWPPALPIILYAVVADVPYENLFIGGALPGLLMFGLIAALGVREGMVTGAGRSAWNAREAAAALWQAKWEVLLPVIVLVAIFGGFATIVESAAVAALYALVSQCFVHRDLSLRRDLLRVFQRCGVVIGGVIVILGVAMGLTSYLIDAQVAARTMEWAAGTLHSKFAFLMALNLLLLVVGCLMDIFSAIVVIVPLIIPISQAFGIDPVHLGIIFVANLELGYLTPPVGLNLFLASYRFGRPVMEIARATAPMLLILLLGVLLITYVPALTLGPLRLLGR
ncbi:MAG TPA: TRAP transporter large permease subunit [Thermoanaerobaculia bacterium]|nr:TRAP transporter large permease subunit [Thermoanaerobaculia bacterium]